MKKYFNYLLIGVALFSFIGISQSEVEAANYDYEHLTGCNKMSSADRTYFKNNFKDEIKKRGIKDSITVKGKKMNINKNFVVKHCTVLYGKESDVKPNSTDSNGQKQFLGYSANGFPLENHKFITLSRNKTFLVDNKSKFYKNPRKNKKLVAITKNKNNIKPDITKYPSDKKRSKYMIDNGITKIQALKTTWDTSYLRKGGGSLGNKGYYPQVSGSSYKWLDDRAIIAVYPSAYSPGTIYMYRKSDQSWDGVAYSADPMPPFKTIFLEENDLSVSQFKPTNSNPWEREKIKFEIKLKNLGEVTITNPKAKFTFNGKTKTVTFKGNLKPGKETKVSKVEVTMPSVEKNTKYTATIDANPDRNNPRNEVDLKNNKKTADVNVKKINRDVMVTDLEIAGDKYFDTKKVKDGKVRIFEGEEVCYRYKVKLESNKSGEKVTNPMIEQGIVGGKTKKEKLNRVLTEGKETGWIYSSFNYNSACNSSKFTK